MQVMPFWVKELGHSGLPNPQVLPRHGGRRPYPRSRALQRQHGPALVLRSSHRAAAHEVAQNLRARPRSTNREIVGEQPGPLLEGDTVDARARRSLP
jgi:hypothetical protein